MSALIDLTGRDFERLKVIRREGSYRGMNGRTMATWLCRCKCGAEIVVVGNNLRTGNTKSCGCLHREERREALSSMWAMWKEAKDNDHDKAATEKTGT